MPDSITYVNSDDIQAALQSNDTEVLTQALIILRNQLTVTDQDTLLPQDERLLLAKSWLEKSPGAQEVFAIIGRSPKPSPKITSLCLTVLTALLNLLSIHFMYHTLGGPIIKILLSSSHIQQLNTYLTDASSDLISSTLTLFNTMSNFAGGVEKRSVMDGFAWGQKSLKKLLFLRRKGKGSRETHTDIRTLCISFILSFLSNTTPTPIKLSLLEQHRDVFLLLFKGLPQDSYAVARRTLEVCWEGVWGDPKIKRTLKVGLFNETTLNHLLKLYDRDAPEDNLTEHVPADLVHHFLLAITTRPGVGICFKSWGWYPRDNSPEEKTLDSEIKPGHGTKIYNKILANIIKSLKVNEDARQQELAFKILEACPEIVAGYWQAANLTLEPRLASRWIMNMSVLGKIISLPIPTSSFLLPRSTHHNPSPPPLPSTTANVLPSVLNKTHLTRGLQSYSSLVQHCTALMLSKCFTKLEKVLHTFHEISRKLEEEDETGQWSKRSRELEFDVERRVPDFMVIVAMVQQQATLCSREQRSPQAALLLEAALRLLWFYHKLFPSLVSKINFDISKLLGIFTPTIGSTDSGDMGNDNVLIHQNQSGLDVLRQLHVVHLLMESDQFAWSSKLGTSSRCHVYAILTLYTKTPHLSVRNATSDLLNHVLSSSILFSHDPHELELWLSALPLTRRGTGVTAPDGTPLTDESTGVLTFLDDCIQRCLKTPYRYLEDGTALLNENVRLKGEQFTRDDPDMSPSPLLMTVLEQLRAKSVAGLLSPSDILAIATFVRKLTCGLTTKMRDLQRVWIIASKVEEILSTPGIAHNSIMMQKAIRRESDLLSHTLRFIQDPHPQFPASTSPAVQDFLLQVEGSPIPSSESASSKAAYEVVDWLRIIHPPLHHTEVDRLLGVIIRLSPSAATEIFYQLDPQSGHMWSGSGDRMKILENISFEWAHLHSTPEQLMRTSVKDSLVSLFFSSKTAWNSSLGRRISICLQRLAANHGMDKKSASRRRAELSLLGSIMQRGHSQRISVDLSQLKYILFLESDPIRELCRSRDISSLELTELSSFVRATLKPHIKSDRDLALAYCNFWMAEAVDGNGLRTCTLASPWIPFMEPMGVINQLDIVINALEGGYLPDDTDQTTMNVVLDTLIHLCARAEVLTELQCRMGGLIVIRSFLHHKETLDALLLLVAESRLPLGCDTLSFTLDKHCRVSDITLPAQERWNARSAHLSLDPGLMTTLLNFKDWDETISRIIAVFIYKSSASRRYFWTWLLETEPSQASSLAFVIIPLHAHLDIMTFYGEDGVNRFPDAWFLAVVRCLFGAETWDGLRALCASCIRLLFRVFASDREHYVTHFTREIQHGNATFLNPQCMRLLRDLYLLDVAAFSPMLLNITERVLDWMVRHFSAGEISEDDITILDEISLLIPGVETKVHLVEPVIKAAIQSCLDVPSVMKCLPTLILSAHLKPAAVNRHIQSIVHHPHLYRTADPSHSSRQPIIELLHTLFHIHPTNTCQLTHIAPLTRLYGGSLSLSDRLLLSIFYLYEVQRKESVASTFRNWSPTPSAPPSQDIIRAITSLDPARVFRTCTAFPTRRRLDGGGLKNLPIGYGDVLYDPVFLTLLVAQLVLEHKILSTMEWVQLFSSNIISVVMCVFTSKDQEFRNVAVTAFAGLLQRIQEADFIEKNQVIYIMNILQDLLPPPSSVPSAPRLPTYSVLLLAHALRATFYPSTFLYPVISRFLLQRPELDTTDVPLLYSLLYSSEDGEWLRERTWMIRFLCEGMSEGSAQDWTVLRRRHTWDLVASMWQAARPEENSLRKAVLEFLANLSANQHATSSLVFRSSLLTWIEMQLETRMASNEEAIAWVKILENIVTAIEHKTETAMRGTLNTSLAQCLHLLLRTISVSDTQIGLLQLISRVALRVTIKFVGHNIAMADLLQHATLILQDFEPLLLWTNEAKSWRRCDSMSIPLPPHHAQGLFDIADAMPDTTSHTRSTLDTWAEAVSTLWSIAMELDSPGRLVDVRTWDILTCRMLLLRASPRFETESRNDVNFEWVRKQTLGCLLSGEVEEERMS